MALKPRLGKTKSKRDYRVSAMALTWNTSTWTLSPKKFSKEFIAVSRLNFSLKFLGIKTSELDTLSAETCAYMSLVHPDFSKLASRIEVSNLHKETDDDYLKVIQKLDSMVDKQGRNASMIHPELKRVVEQNREKINAKLNYSRDFNYDFFGFKTLERSYLLKAEGKIVETPQHMLMRCSLGIHLDDLESAFETYDLMSEMWFTHATPTLFNSGTPKP